MARDREYYPTPAWCVHWLLEYVALPPGLWLEPHVGSGSIIRAVNHVRKDVTWLGNDIAPQLGAREVAALASSGSLREGDFGTLSLDDFDERPVLVIGNPPFSQALEHIRHSVEVLGLETIFHLRLDFLSSAKRASWLCENTPDVYVLSGRPSYGAGSDFHAAAWMRWRAPKHGRAPGRAAHIAILQAPGSRRLL